MNNKKSEFKVSFHITFQHEDGRVKEVYDSQVVEANSEDEANTIILDIFENSDDPLTEFPDGWFGEISSEDLSIDKIEKVWEY